MVDVSIVMPVFNVEQYLEKSIKSVLNQTHSNIELILVNDGSTDNSGGICDKFKAMDDRIKVVHKKNAGSGFARNSGMEIAIGEYIYFADPDDYVELNLVEDNYSIAKETQADIIEFGYYEEKNNQGEIQAQKEKNPTLKGVLEKKDFRNKFQEFHSFRPLSLWNKLYRRNFLEKNKYMFTDQKVGQDALFLLDVYRGLEKITFNPKAYYHYVDREGSAVNKYRPARTQYEYNIARKFHDLIQYWGTEEKHSILVHKHYWRIMFIELKYLNFEDCPLSNKEKIERVKEWSKNQYVYSAVFNDQLYREVNVFHRFLIFLIRKNKYNLALNAMRIRLKIKK